MCGFYTLCDKLDNYWNVRPRYDDSSSTLGMRGCLMTLPRGLFAVVAKFILIFNQCPMIFSAYSISLIDTTRLFCSWLEFDSSRNWLYCVIKWLCEFYITFLCKLINLNKCKSVNEIPNFICDERSCFSHFNSADLTPYFSFLISHDVWRLIVN